jgi:purine catabolism regulator
LQLSVRAALALPSLTKAQVLGGAEGLDRPVTWVHIVEVLGDPFLLPRDTVILTHGYGLEDPEAATRFLTSASAAGVAALGVAVGPERPPLPQALIALADERRLPLLQLPPGARFRSACEEAVEVLLTPDGVTEDRLFARLQEIRRQGGSYGELVTETATTLGATVLLTNRRKRILVSYAPTDEGAPARYAELLAKTASLERIFRSRSLVVVTPSPESGDPPLVMVPVVLDDDIHGSLAVATAAPVNDALTQALEDASRVMALQAFNLRLDFDHDHDLADELSDLLLSPSPSIDPGTRRRLLHVGFDLDHPFRVVLIRPGIDEGSRHPAHPRGALSTLTRHLVQGEHYTPLVTSDEQRIVVIKEAHPDGAKAEVEGLTRVHEELAARYADLPIRIVAGGPGLLGDLDKSLEEAERALSVAQAQHPEGGVLAFEDLGIDSLLMDMLRSPRAAAWVTEVMRPLTVYDKKKKSPLLRRTLETYLALDCNAERTAEKLYLHPNTVRYRLRLIEELTGRPLAVQGHRTAFQVALCFMALLEDDPTGDPEDGWSEQLPQA